MNDDDRQIKATPYQWRDPSKIPTRTASLREKEAEIKRLREALRDVLVYAPDYMHGMPKKHYANIAEGKAG